MKHIAPQFFLLFLCMSSAIASCDSFPPKDKLEEKSCNCTSKSPDGLTYPDGLKLTYVCNYSKMSEDEIYGNFFFKSDLLLTGHIRHEESDGRDLYFVPTSQDRKLNRFTMADFRFDINNAPSQFHAPKLDQVTWCWIAPATLKIKSVHISLFDSGGAFIQNYDILSLGKFRKCKSNESGFSQ